MLSKKFLHLLSALLIVSLLASCQETAKAPELSSEYPADVAISWFDLQLKLIQETPGFTPPVASRALGYSGVALYESVVGGMPKNRSLVKQLNDLASLPQLEAGREYHWAAVANSTMANILRSLYPAATPKNLASIDALEQTYAKQYKTETGDDVFNRSAAYGKVLAAAIFEWSKTDGGHEGYLKNFPESFAPPSGPGLWIPTPPGYQSIPLHPYWGRNRPFALKSGREFAPPAPTPYSEDPSSKFYAEAMEVYRTIKNLTPEQKAIALFWEDGAGKTGTPAGHSVAIATHVLRRENADLALAAETYARVGISVADSFISCWSTKYTYNLIRPISYIQKVIDPAWNNPNITDPVATPAFPEYVSGHSVQAAAAATVLTDLFGDSYQFTDLYPVERGLPARSFDSFSEAADEAAISRLYGGIHFRPAIEVGLVQGKRIGERANKLKFR